MTVVLKGQKARPGENKRTPSFVFLTGSRVLVLISKGIFQGGLNLKALQGERQD